MEQVRQEDESETEAVEEEVDEGEAEARGLENIFRMRGMAG